MIEVNKSVKINNLRQYKQYTITEDSTSSNTQLDTKYTEYLD